MSETDDPFIDLEKSTLKRAADHIRLGEFNQARTLLFTIPNNPKAVEWLTKLNDPKYQPAPDPISPTSNRVRDRTGLIVAAVIVELLLFALQGFRGGLFGLVALPVSVYYLWVRYTGNLF